MPQTAKSDDNLERVCPSISVSVRVCMRLCMCLCIFIVHAGSEGSCFRLALPRSRSRILARGLQVAYGTGLGENEISDPFTPILRPLQYHE